MVNYRRNKLAGGTYFFTATLQDRNSKLLTNQICLLSHSFRKVKQKYPFVMHAIVVLPDHLHCIMKLPKNDDNYSLRWQSLKSEFTKVLRMKGVPLCKNKRGEYTLWQRRFWEHTIRDDKDLENHINYIHYNPIKHGLVEALVNWPYSSFHRFVINGLLEENWGDNFRESGDGFGE